MRIIDFIDPRTDLNTWDNFKQLSGKQKALTLLVSAVAFVALLGYGGFVTFRALTHFFSKTESPLRPGDQKIHNEASPLLNPEPLERPRRAVNTNISTMVKWKQMMSCGLDKGLAPLRMQHGFAEESGDCFFDSVAQVLNKIRPGENHTKQSVRLKLKEHLPQCQDNRYEQLLRGNADGYRYPDFCERIGDCVEDIKQGAPIWGNNVTLQLVADAYHVNIETHSVMTFELSLMESMNDQWENFEKHQYTRGESEIIVEVCTELDTNEFHPDQGDAVETIHLGNMSRGPWGHFVPVFPRR